MDWIDLAWPWYYKELQTQSTNALDSMMYPKVQKLVTTPCLFSQKDVKVKRKNRNEVI